MSDCDIVHQPPPTDDQGRPVEYRRVAECPEYLAGSDGSVWGCRPGHRPRRLTPFPGSGGRPRVQLSRGGWRKKASLAALVLGAFAGPRPAGTGARHADGDVANCRLDNLEWAAPPQRPSSPRATPLALRLAALRRAAGLTQRALARAAGAPRARLAKFEQGRVRDPGCLTLARLAGALGVPLEAIIGDPG